jgi:hypothetical protein
MNYQTKFILSTIGPSNGDIRFKTKIIGQSDIRIHILKNQLSSSDQYSYRSCLGIVCNGFGCCSHCCLLYALLQLLYKRRTIEDY